MMFRDINQSSTMARSAYPDGNGELTDFSLFATKYDAGKPSIATDGLPSELSYQVRTAIRRAVDELGINVPEAAVVLKYPIHFYYSDASAELTGVLARGGDPRTRRVHSQRTARRARHRRYLQAARGSG